MKIRKITSLTAALSFVLMVVTSVVLYIVPQGRVAYWADWHLLGLTKTEWGNIHINSGLLFLISLFLHIYYNWKALISYLKNKAKQIKVFTPDFSLALAVTLSVAVGTYMLAPPFRWVMSLNDHFKDSGAETYGEPPYGHAELSSLKTFAQKLNLDLEKSMTLLNQAGYAVTDSALTLKTIGEQNHIPPQQVYETIKPAAKNRADRPQNAAALPESPRPGTGKLTLADFCAKYGLNIKWIVRELNQQAIDASEELTLKAIAHQNNLSAIDLYERIKDIIKG
jgi:sulfur carrier protein ThiS